jgi:hypothetical protein
MKPTLTVKVVSRLTALAGLVALLVERGHVQPRGRIADVHECCQRASFCCSTEARAKQKADSSATPTAAAVMAER